MKTVIHQFTRDDRGGVAVAAAGFMAVGVAFIGAAITYSQAASTRTSYRRALDAAVIAGALLPTSATEGDRKATAEAAFQGSLSQQARNAAPPQSPTFQVSGSGTDDVKVTGEAAAGATNPFGGLIGGDTIDFKVAAAAKKGVSDPICVMALNKTDNGAMDLNGTVNVTTSCPAQANSSDSSAVRAVGNARMNTSVFAVTGDVKGKDAFSPMPETRASRVADPLASVPFPPKGSCHPLSNAKIQNNTTLTPGTYCGGLDISSGAVVTMEPGIYIFADDDFKISGGAQLAGQEVLLAYTNSKFWMTGGAVMKVTSPRSGPYTNMQFMEDAVSQNGNHWVSIGGDSTLEYDGTMYFPNSNIWIYGGSVVKGKSPNLIMVGDKIWFQDNSKIELTQVNTRGLPVKETPRLRYGAVMVQ